MSNEPQVGVIVNWAEGKELVERVNALLQLTDAENPKPADVQALQTLIAGHPEVWQQLGDLAFHAQEGILRLASNQLLVQAAIRKSAEELRHSLTLSSDTPVERLMVAHCVTSFLLHSAVERRYAEAHKFGMSPEDSLYWEKRLNAAQHRFLRAVETLTRLRRMSAPLMQVNIGKRQTNIAVNTSSDAAPSSARRARSTRRGTRHERGAAAPDRENQA